MLPTRHQSSDLSLMETIIATFRNIFDKEVTKVYVECDEAVKNAPGFLKKVARLVTRKGGVGLVAGLAENGIETAAQGTDVGTNAGKLVGAGLRTAFFLYFMYKDKKDERTLDLSKTLISRVRKLGGIEAVLSKVGDHLVERFIDVLSELGEGDRRQDDLGLLAKFFAASLLNILMEDKGLSVNFHWDYIYESIVPDKGHALYQADLHEFMRQPGWSLQRKFSYAPLKTEWTVEGLLTGLACITFEGDYLSKDKENDLSNQFPVQYINLSLARKLGYSEARPRLKIVMAEREAKHHSAPNSPLLHSHQDKINISEKIKKFIAGNETYDLVKSTVEIVLGLRKARHALRYLIEDYNRSSKETVAHNQLLAELIQYTKYLLLDMNRRYLEPAVMPNLSVIQQLKKELAWLKTTTNHFLQLVESVPLKLSSSEKNKMTQLYHLHLLLEDIAAITLEKTIDGSAMLPNDPQEEAHLNKMLAVKKQLTALMNTGNSLLTLIHPSFSNFNKHWYSETEMKELVSYYQQVEMGDEVEVHYVDDSLEGCMRKRAEQKAQGIAVKNKVLIFLNENGLKWVLFYLQFFPEKEHQVSVDYIDPLWKNSASLTREEQEEKQKELTPFFGNHRLTILPSPVKNDEHHTIPWLIEYARVLVKGGFLDAHFDINLARKQHRKHLEQLMATEIDKDALNLPVASSRDFVADIHALLRKIEVVAGLPIGETSDPLGIKLEQQVTSLEQAMQTLKTDLFFMAITAGNWQQVTALKTEHGLEAFTILHPTGINALYQAAVTGQVKIFNYLMADIPLEKRAILTTFKTPEGFNLLHAATIGGQPSLIGELIKYIPINAVALNQQTALHVAALSPHLNKQEIIEILVEHGADVLVKDDKGQTPLHAAFASGWITLNIVQILCRVFTKNAREESHLSLPSKIGQIVDQHDQTWLHATAKCISSPAIGESAKWLCAQNFVDMMAQDKDGNTALHLAADALNFPVITALIAASADACLKNKEGFSCVNLLEFKQQIKKQECQELAERQKKLEQKIKNERKTLSSLMTEMELTRRESIKDNINEWTLAFTIVEKNLIYAQELLKNIEQVLPGLKHYIKAMSLLPSQQEQLVNALLSSNKAELETLLYSDKRLYLRKLQNNRHLFHLAAEVATVKMLQDLIEILKAQDMYQVVLESPKPADWKPRRLNELLTQKVKDGNLKEVEELLKAGADLHTKSSTGKSLLHVAAENNQLAVFNYLLARGLHCPEEDNVPRPLLHIATESPTIDFLNVLLPLAPNKEVKNANGHTALHHGILKGSLEAIRCLLSAGLNPNAVDAKGNTALHLAIKYNRDNELLTELLNKGADYKERNQAGLRPSELSTKVAVHDFLKRQHQAIKAAKLKHYTDKISFLEKRIQQQEAKNKLSSLDSIPEENTSSLSLLKRP